MPSNWSMIDNNFPSFTGDERPKEQIAQLQNYLMLLVEQLKYQLNNLSAINWNDSALEQLQADTTKDVEKELSNVAGDLSQTATDLASVVTRLARVETALASLEMARDDHENRIGDLEDRADELDADLDNLFAVVKPDGTGGADIGGAGKEIRLVGKIYLNGVLMGGGST